MLYDFYGTLLNENQQEVMALYNEDNYSLSEIAEELGTTRQAIHYTLKKAEHSLTDYEDKLGLVAAYIKNQQLAEEIQEILARIEIPESDRARIKTMLDKIVE